MSIAHETLITFAQATRLVPGRPHVSTIWRWAVHGIRGGVQLESFKVGGINLTSKEAIQRFLAACNQTPQERADQQLQKEGC